MLPIIIGFRDEAFGLQFRVGDLGIKVCMGIT